MVKGLWGYLYPFPRFRVHLPVHFYSVPALYISLGFRLPAALLCSATAQELVEPILRPLQVWVSACNCIELTIYHIYFNYRGYRIVSLTPGLFCCYEVQLARAYPSIEQSWPPTTAQPSWLQVSKAYTVACSLISEISSI